MNSWMGIQSMVTHGIGGGGDGKQTEAPAESLSRERSPYSLTLNGVQNQLEGPLSSMNLDEILRNVLPPEGEQFDASLGLQTPRTMDQGRALRKKTVDEVWLDIQRGQSNGDGEARSDPQGQLSVGEMTLEDFLVNAGVVVKETDEGTSNVSSTTSTDQVLVGGSSGYSSNLGNHWLQAYHHQQPRERVMAIRTTPPPAIALLEPVYSDSPRTVSSSTLGAFSDSQTLGSKRGISGDLGEQTAERRQKRMIKNRESAARSRARKQAYTNELENKISRLEEENKMLKKHRELEKLLYCTPAPEPRVRLRRTSTAPF